MKLLILKDQNKGLKEANTLHRAEKSYRGR